LRGRVEEEPGDNVTGRVHSLGGVQLYDLNYNACRTHLCMSDCPNGGWDRCDTGKRDNLDVFSRPSRSTNQLFHFFVSFKVFPFYSFPKTALHLSFP
jgi:hypothetical protein